MLVKAIKYYYKIKHIVKTSDKEESNAEAGSTISRSGAMKTFL